MPCELEKRGEGLYHCKTCNRYHFGHTLDKALSDEAAGRAYRAGIAEINSMPKTEPGANAPEADTSYKRDPETARLCIYLGANLTEEEVNKYQDELRAGGIPCRNCNGSIPGHHCSSKEAGPFTRIAGKCTSCNHWKQADENDLRNIPGTVPS